MGKLRGDKIPLKGGILISLTPTLLVGLFFYLYKTPDDLKTKFPGAYALLFLAFREILSENDPEHIQLDK